VDQAAPDSKNVAVIGAGAMGLAAAFHLLQLGHKVTVLESSPVPGGMAAHFDFDGLSIERFYHFVCKSDKPLFDLLNELGLSESMRWRDTRMGFFNNGRLQKWGDPVALLRFSGLSFVAKMRYGLHAFLSTRRSNWAKLDKLDAQTWLKRWIGEEAYRVCWDRLIQLKFFDYSDRISAAWVWARIKRVGTSRKNVLQEQLGYIDGGSETLVTTLVDRIEQLGGKIMLATPVKRIMVTGKTVRGIETEEGEFRFDAVISTVAIPYAVDMLIDLPADLVERYRALPNIGVVCVVHKLRRAVSEYFWMNINDYRFEIPGIIEFSNLRDVGNEHVVYVPYYMPQTHQKFSWPDGEFIAETKKYLKMINSELSDEDFISCRVGRLRYAQPVCGTQFLQDLPPVCPGIEGLQVADTSYYYPEDRGISESVHLAKEMAANVG
jgi:protoporphyrinogen oxidase